MIHRDIYEGLSGYIYAVHANGFCYAQFSGANQALAYWRGLNARDRGYFHLENGAGETVTCEEQSRGHAYAILASLDRAAAVTGEQTP